MNKSELVDSVAETAELNKQQALRAVNAVFEAISNAMSKGEQFTMVGFGTFSVKDRAARNGRNPQTGETISIAAAKIPAFKPGIELKRCVN